MKAGLKRWRPLLIAIAVASIMLSLINASWLAPTPPGRLTLVARGGIGQQVDRASLGSDPCTARHIKPGGDNNYIENSLPSIYAALKLGAQAIEIPVQRTRDGQVVLFADASLDCRTNGKGRIGDHDLAELKTFDIGYGYSPDGGRTFPLRGRGIGAMPSVEDVLRYVPTAGIVFALKGNQAEDAEALVAAIRRAGVPIDEKYSFTGPPLAIARIRQLMPGAWAYGEDDGQACVRDYGRIGWTSIVPESCRNTTIALPLGKSWTLWGWPYRFFDRMTKTNAKVLIYGQDRDGQRVGLDQPEQYDRVPARFHGSLLVEDIYTMGPALRR